MRFEDFQDKLHQRAAREAARYIRTNLSSRRAICNKKLAGYYGRLQAVRQARASEASAHDIFNKDPIKWNHPANVQKRVNQLGAEVGLFSLEIFRKDDALGDDPPPFKWKPYDARLMPNM
jgi:hypothetical protein